MIILKEFLEIINTWAPSIAVVVSALISYLVAKLKAKNEIKKVMLNFNRDDEVTKKQAFATFMSATEEFYNFPNGGNRNKAIEATANYLHFAPSGVRELLPQMDIAISEKNLQTIKNLRLEIYSLESSKIKSTAQNSRTKKQKI